MSDRGIPRSWRHMNGYGSHTLGFWNAQGERYWVKWHFKTDQGVRSLSNNEAASMPPYGAQQDLVEAIERGEYPTWTVKLQILTEDAAKNFPINPFDLTKVWPHELAPLQEIGKLTLDRNVGNYFAETEQAAFAPSNLVPGICPSPDKMLQARLLAYQDAHRYRLGVNHNQLSVNAPRCPMHHYQRDGAMASVGRNQDSDVNFYPNDNKCAPRPVGELAPPPLPLVEDAWVMPYCQDEEDYFEQAGNLFRILSGDEKLRLAETIAVGLSQAEGSVQQRIVEFIGKADSKYAAMVREAMTFSQ
jgi:catalase